jgi:hypothetical protein
MGKCTRENDYLVKKKTTSKNLQGNFIEKRAKMWSMTTLWFGKL